MPEKEKPSPPSSEKTDPVIVLQRERFAKKFAAERVVLVYDDPVSTDTKRSKSG